MANALRVIIVVVFCLMIGLANVLDFIHADASASNAGNAKVEISFKDLQEHWSKAYVKALVDKKVVNGFPDGTFRPQSSVTVAEFTKIIVTSLGHQPNTVVGKKHWAQGYMDKALYEGLIMSTEKEFQAYDKPMTRGQVARMIYRALSDPQEFHEMTYYQYMIKDFGLTHLDNRIEILNCFRKGIITGYSDGTFRDHLPVTRAEASTMVMRYLDENMRIEPVLPYAEGVTVYESSKGTDTSFAISYNISLPLNPQLISVNKYLMKYVDDKTRYSLLEYASIKTDTKSKLIKKDFKPTNSKYTVSVISGPNTAVITIRGTINEAQ